MDVLKSDSHLDQKYHILKIVLKCDTLFQGTITLYVR